MKSVIASFIVFAPFLWGCSSTTSVDGFVDTGSVPDGGGGSAGGTTDLGGEGGVDVGGGGQAPQVCIPQEVECEGDTKLTCLSDGTDWVAQPCSSTCLDGECVDCLPTDPKKCSGLDIEACSAQGKWITISTCPYVCKEGSCTGECSPSDKRCNGLAPEVCDSSGTWVASGNPCPYVCTQGGACTGACSPKTVQCNDKMVQTCSDQGTWENTQTCPYVCIQGTCSGVCVPNQTQCNGNAVQTCNSVGQWSTGATCPFVCQLGACTGVCVPNTKQCSGTSTQTCSTNGTWATPTACPGAANADPTCSGNGVCGWSCQVGYVDCNTSPGDGCEIQLGTVSDCLSCGNTCASSTNSVGVCTAQGCGLACTGLWGDCNNNSSDGCEHDVSNDSMNCGGCGIECYGGACIAGKCQYPVERVGAGSANYLAVDSGWVYWRGSSSINKTPTTGGSATFLSTVTTGGAFATDGKEVFWSEYLPTWAVKSVSVSGGNPTTLTNSYFPSRVVTDGVYLYWQDQPGNPCYCTKPKTTKIYRMLVTGGQATVIATIPYELSLDIAIDASHIYVASHGSFVSAGGCNWQGEQCQGDYSGLVYAVPKGGTPYVLAACAPTAQEPLSCYSLRKGMNKVVVNSTHVFFEADANGLGRNLYRVSKSGGQVQLILKNFNGSPAFVANDSFVYITYSTEVRKTPVNAEAVSIVAVGQWSVQSNPALDTTHVYWGTSGFNPPGYFQYSDPSIMRAPL